MQSGCHAEIPSAVPWFMDNQKNEHCGDLLSVIGWLSSSAYCVILCERGVSNASLHLCHLSQSAWEWMTSTQIFKIDFSEAEDKFYSLWRLCLAPPQLAQGSTHLIRGHRGGSDEGRDWRLRNHPIGRDAVRRRVEAVKERRTQELKENTKIEKNK